MRNPTRDRCWRSAIALLALIVLGDDAAYASKARLRLDRIDARRCAQKGELDLYFVELELEGVLVDRPPFEYQLVVDGKARRERPLHAGRGRGEGRPLHLALVIENSPAYAADLSVIRDAAKAFVRGLPRDARVTVISYGDEVQRLHRQQSPREAAAEIDQIAASAAGIDLALVDALQQAMQTLAGAPAGAERLIVAISDGLNREPDWDLFRAMGSRARRLAVRIAPVAYSPIDERGPLLSLGELAKRSLGTFRWARSADKIETELEHLAQELTEPRVLSFRAPGRCRRSMRIAVAAGPLRSNELTVDPRRAEGAPVTGGSSPTWLVVVGVLVAALVLAAATWLLLGGLRRRR